MGHTLVVQRRHAVPGRARGHRARPRGGRAAEGREPRPRGAGHQARRHDGLRRLPRGLRGAGREGAQQQAHARRLRRRHDVAHQPGRPRHGGLGARGSWPARAASSRSAPSAIRRSSPAVPEERLREFGVSKVMTVTSTYDHRVIQGAESGAFLATAGPPAPGRRGLLRAHRREPRLSARQLPAGAGRARGQAGQESAGPVAPEMLYHVAAAMALVKAFRMHGHLAAHLDPLGTPPIGDPALDPGPLGLTPEVMAAIPSKVLRIAVPGRTLAEVAALPPGHLLRHHGVRDRAHRRPTRSGSGCARRSRAAPTASRWRPTSSAGCCSGSPRWRRLEKFLHKAYLGQKRFSIEGVDMLVPMLDLTIERAAESGRARRGDRHGASRAGSTCWPTRSGRPYETIFAEFEGGRHVEAGQLTPEGGTGDVKYHHGAEGAYVTTGKDKAITVTLSPNPSHLEFVGPVVDGRARAKQTQRRGRDAHHDPTAALPVIIHGDAAFAGQGVVAETLNLGALKGYRTGGTLHLITNNQVGFTTDMEDARSHPLRLRPGQGLRHPDHPRQRRRRRGLPQRGPAGDGVSRPVPPGRADRPGRLPPARPQRGRRAGLHPAADVRADQDAARPCGTCYAQQLVAAGVLTQEEADRAGERGLPAAGGHPAGLQGEHGQEHHRASTAPS